MGRRIVLLRGLQWSIHDADSEVVSSVFFLFLEYMRSSARLELESSCIPINRIGRHAIFIDPWRKQRRDLNPAHSALFTSSDRQTLGVRWD